MRLTKQQIEAILILNKLSACIGYYEGALKGSWSESDEVLAKIELKQAETDRLLLELQEKILELNK